MSVQYAEWQPGQDYEVIDLPGGSSIVFVTGNHRLLKVDAATGARLRQGLAALSAEEAREWNRLAESGIVSEVNRNLLAASSFSDGANLAININLTAFCNLGCSYCFADGGDYGRIKGMMESETVDYIFDFIRQHVTASQTVRFEFFGGEPLLNFARIQEVCDRAEELERTTGIRFIHRISSNLTVLPPGCLELFARHRFIVSVSIDGGEATHDRNRPTKGGQGSFRKILAHCRQVRAASDEITLVARMTVVDDAVPLVDNVLELWQHNIFDYFQIYPGVVPVEKNEIFVPLGKKAAEEPSTSTTVAPTFLPQLSALLEIYPRLLEPGNRFRGVLEYERMAEMVLDGKLALSYCSGGRNYYTFSPDNSIMPCHRLVGGEEFQVGQGADGLTASVEEWHLPVDGHPTCSRCWIRYACGGGCKQENFLSTGSLNDPNPEMCRYQIQLVENVVRMIAAQDRSYQERNRVPLEDLFVSCGRPLVMNMRSGEEVVPEDLRYFQLI